MQTDRASGTTVADRYKFSAVRRLSRRHLDRSKNAIFTYLTCIWRPCYRSFESWSWHIVRRCFFDPMFSYFCTIPACEGQTDGRPDTGLQHIHRADKA